MGRSREARLPYAATVLLKVLNNAMTATLPAATVAAVSAFKKYFRFAATIRVMGQKLAARVPVIAEYARLHVVTIPATGRRLAVRALRIAGPVLRLAAIIRVMEPKLAVHVLLTAGYVRRFAATIPATERKLAAPARRTAVFVLPCAVTVSRKVPNNAMTGTLPMATAAAALASQKLRFQAAETESRKALKPAMTGT